MQKNYIKHLSKRILCILILFIIIFMTTTFQIKSYGATYTYTNTYNNLPADFDEKYPGYRTLINTIVSEHPNWTINVIETGLDWNTVIENESKHGRNLVQPGYYTVDYGCSCNVAYDGPWKCASRAAVEYMMDPRNFINSYDIFQFQDLTSSTGDISAIRSMISGTFMDKDQYREDCINGIIEAANSYGISPYFIVSKIIQEQSSGGSVLSLGEGYDVNNDGSKEYVGYYNLFNIGAYEADGKSTIENGLAYAQNKGWDSMYKSIVSGAKFIKNSYLEVGQTTMYFQKYNVINKSNLYYNQYMTNVWGAYSEGKIMRRKYINYGIYENSFTFLIPLYTGMPEAVGDLARVNADPGLKLKDAPAGNYLLTIDQNVIVRVIERATTKIDGTYYWDKVKTPYGTGYMARNASDNSKQYLETLNLITPTVIDTSTNNNISEPDEKNIIKIEPNVTVSKIKEKYTNAIIKNKNGEEINGDTLVGTGAKIYIDEQEKYTVVKLGDANGDGKINSADLLRIQKYLLNVITLDETVLNAADSNKDGIINSADLLKIQKHLLKVSNLTIN